jgi:hypothetical protein
MAHRVPKLLTFSGSEMPGMSLQFALTLRPEGNAILMMEVPAQ